jgi:hypothetical protein
MQNAEIVNRLSLHDNCGKSPIVNTRWHYCVPCLNDADFDLCSIGEMDPHVIDAFVTQRPWLQQVRTLGVIGAVTRNLNLLSQPTRSRAEEILQGGTLVPVAYRGCMACMMFRDAGVWADLAGRIRGTT